ncbi:MAG TPA: LamG domain-containing protein [Candidatus Paceibacterota bacterium]|nr:LamG domain-containing protein [Candidatus Paceibacterota bacterium]
MFSSLLHSKKIRFTFVFGFVVASYLLMVLPLHAGTFSKPPSNLGLVGYWSFDESAGTIAHDFSGFGQNGNLNNMEATDWINGKRGKALDFDGVNEYVSVTDSQGRLNISSTVTISMWVKDSVWDDGDLLSKASGSYAFWSHVGTGMRFGRQGGAENQWAIGPFPQTGKWVHIVGVSNGSNALLYYDGVLVATSGASMGSMNNGGAVAIGAGVGTGDDGYVSAQIDDVRIYNRALSLNEIQALYSNGQVTRKVVSNRGLVGHWSFDEGTSTIAHDFSGNSLHGTLTNMAPHTDWVGGKKGKALDFDGTDDFIALGNPSALNITGQITLSAWVNFSSFPSNNNGCANYCGIIMEKGFDGTREAYVLRYSGSPAKLEVLTFGPSIDYGTSWNINFPINTWHHVVGLYNGTSWVLYVDGVLVASAVKAVGAQSSSANAAIGGAYISGTPGRFFPGKIDDVRVYSRALSDSEVQALYNQNQTAINSSQQNRFTDGLVGYWSFNGSDISWANNIAYDRSGRNSNAVITSMSTTTSPVPGKSGQALRFDAVDDIVNAGSASSLDDLIPMSVSFWIKPNSAGEGNQSRVVAKNGNIGVAGQWQITLVTGAGCLAGEASLTNAIYFIKVGSTATARAGRCGASNSFTIGEWQHFMVTWDGSTGYNNSGSRIYRNGVEISYHTVVAGATDSAGSDASLDLVIGNRADTARTFDGAIDEVRVYNRVLSVDEAKQLYRLGR